jgi:hypothetical protein
MNNILHLKGQFKKKNNNNKPGNPKLPVGKSVKVQHLVTLKNQLQSILAYWQNDKTINGALVSVYYYHVVAKSNRLKGLLCKGSSDPNDSIRGSKFYGENPIQHVFTHYVKLDVLEDSIKRLELCIDIVNREYKGEITHDIIENLNKNVVEYKNKMLAKSSFVKVIVDAYYVEKFSIDRDTEQIDERTIVTIYKTDVKTTDLLGKIGINMIDAKVIDETTIRLDPDEFKLLVEKAPYLIAMKVHDLREIMPEDINMVDPRIVEIPSPKNEPTIGVIDTLFYENVYFKEWVTYICMVDEQIPTDIEDCYHGTGVTSIIVDGPAINPDLDDGCGRFRVRHFGVATKGRFSSFTILKAIRKIVASNRDIKVWNLSLGSDMEINRNFLSPEGAELDKLQSEYDVIFVVAGTNKKKDTSESMRIGAPADSINSIVVNAVDFDGNPASYHRVGPVLSFFHKPDISYYGGDTNKKMRICTPYGEGFVSGTSFAAPWISRKMAFLIHNMGFTREVAKALLIDSAAGWDRKDNVSHSIGYGVVPIRIEDIIQSPDDEIRFILTGSTDAYETYNYNIPVPSYNDKYPFFAKATLCYFPKCSRNQGVDYTSTEMDIHFGRIKEDKDGTKIKSIDDNRQGDNGFIFIPEENARKLYRKWDNVKLIHEAIKDRSRPRKMYSSAGLWGLSIITKERLRNKNGKGLQFGVVITLKEMNGINRIDDFIKRCLVRGWIVNEININNQLDVYNKAEEDIIFDE